MAALIIAIFPQNSSRGNREEQQDRTDPNSRFELARKPAWLLAFRQFGLPKWKHDFESGNSVPDKVARAGFHVTKSEHVDAPMIDELPLTLECKLVSFDEETELLLGEVVNVSVDERALDENGKLAVEKLHVITFDYANHGYYVLGEKVASAFEDGKKFK